MRSELIFSASVRVPNRFLLCRMVSLSTGRLHRTGECMSVSINKCLGLAQQPNGPNDARFIRVAGRNSSPQVIDHRTFENGS